MTRELEGLERAFPDLVERDDYFYELPEGFPAIPLSFSLRAEKPD